MDTWPLDRCGDDGGYASMLEHPNAEGGWAHVLWCPFAVCSATPLFLRYFRPRLLPYRCNLAV